MDGIHEVGIKFRVQTLQHEAVLIIYISKTCLMIMLCII